MIENRLAILILQHPQERREPLATAALVAASLATAKIAVGLSWANLAQALGSPADPRNWAVLHLGAAQPQALLPGEEIVFLDQGGNPRPDASERLRRLDGLVLLDGSWKEAKTLWWRNPWLLKLHRLVLNPLRPARFGGVRREPRREALSTLEAAALVLRRAEPGPEAADALMAALDGLLSEVRPTATFPPAPPRLRGRTIRRRGGWR
jgi:DTW domain-containing protein YfiP